jgi:penicillin-binding protein 1B
MPSRRGSALAAVLGVVALLILAALGLTRYAEDKLSNLVVGGLGESFSTRIYGAPFVVTDGGRESPERLLQRLDRLGYVKVSSSPASGQYEWTPPELVVNLRGFTLPQRRQLPGVVFMKSDGKSWKIEGASGAAPLEAALEPEVVAELSGAKKVRREPATWDEMPENLKNAVVAVEDHRFYRHWGIDVRAVGRAALRDLFGRGTFQGGSTITQQLAKNFFLTPRRTMSRKALEALLAVYLEVRYSKKEILTLYLNQIYFGQDGPVSVAGVKAAANHYFGKRLGDLTLDECATLAALIRSPYRYDPLRDPLTSKRRRDFVLERMAQEHFITDDVAKAATATPLAAVPRKTSAPQNDYAYYTAEVVRRLLPRYSEQTIFRYGLKIHTAMDPMLQQAAQRALHKARYQAALVALDPADGRVLALAGGKEYGESQFNRATQARRQPGSSFKPFVYGAALEIGYTAATLLSDTTRTFRRDDARTWEPRNFDHVYRGTTTVREALALSLNAATLDLASRVGPSKVASFASRMGIASPIAANLGVALGVSEVSLLELTEAYAPFDNGGYRTSPLFVTAVLDADNQPIEVAPPPIKESVLSPAVGYMVTSLMETTVKQGTAKSLAKLGWDRPAAGKTGTTNDGRDAWFVGYTPELLAGVWAGSDEHKAIRAGGGKDAVPIWAEFMKQAEDGLPTRDFDRPPGIDDVKIDPTTGYRALSGCPTSKEELFISGTEPADCPAHPGGIKGFFKKLFGKN